MNRRIYLAIAACLCIQFTFAQSQHGWRGENRDGIYNESGLLKLWPADGPGQLWATEDAGKGYSSPVIVGDRLYITGLDEDENKEVFSAYTLDGNRLYQVEYGSPWSASYSYSRTTPTIVGDRAYVISGMGEIVCLNTTDGKIIWSVDGGTKFEKKQGIWGTSEAPLVFDNKIIYSPGGNQTTVVALSAITGETLWKSKSLGEASSYVSPLLIEHKGKRQIIGLTDKHVYGINPETGVMGWEFFDGIIKTERETDRKICCNTPLYKDGKLFISNGYDIGSVMIELNDDLTGVKQLWRNEDLDTHIGGYVLVDGVIYGSSWTSNNSGDWVAVDWNTGETKYKTPWAGKGKGSIISDNKMLYCYDERRGTVALVNANPEKFDIVSEFRITLGEGPHWAHPVINNGILYIRHGGALMAYEIK
jgi:outer membrane protein assembly factor BamB